MAKYQPKDIGTKSEKLLAEIRERYHYGLMRWEPTRLAMRDSLKCLTSEYGPWPEDELTLRLKPVATSNGEVRSKRPAIHSDILSQYVNRSVGRLRSFKRGIKIAPTGLGGDEKTAERREARIRQIEYEERAWQSRYWAATCQRRQGYGAWKLAIEPEGPRTFRKKIAILPIPNPMAVVIDPDTRRPDRSDMKWAFETERMTQEAFVVQFGESAQKVSFAVEDQALAKDWIFNDDLLVANYWRVTPRKAKLLLVRTPAGLVSDQDVWSEIIEEELDQLPDNVYAVIDQSIVEDEQDTEIPEAFQYVTNGVEILDEQKLPWSSIPLIFLPGREEYRMESFGGRPGELVLESMIYKAIPAQLTYDFALTNQVEAASQIPKTKFLGYTGTFHGDWENAHRDPKAYLEADPTLPGVGSGTEPLPLPQVIEFRPPIDLFEIMKQAAIREAENAMGMSSVEKQDRIGKSGKALEALEGQMELGAVEFDDPLDRAIEYEGRLINEALDIVEDSAREVGLRKNDDTYEKFKLEPQQDEDGRVTWHPYGRAEAHSVTISVGPTLESQQREAEDFVEKLMSTNFAPLFLDQLIRFKRLGQPGEIMEKRAKAQLPPAVQQMEDGELPPEAVGPIQKMSQQLQQKDAENQAMVQKLAEFEREKAGKVLENQGRLAIERFKATELVQKLATFEASTEERLQAMELASKEAIAAMEQRVKLAIEAEKMDIAEAQASIAGVEAPGVHP